MLRSIRSIRNFSLSIKKTVQAGDAKTFAKPGDFVEVHYEGRLAASGKLFDSSRARREVFRFRIGDQMVIPGFTIKILFYINYLICVLSDLIMFLIVLSP